MLRSITAAIILSAPALAAAAESTSSRMSFSDCQATQEATIAQLGVSSSDVARIVKTSDMTMTKIYVSDGSVIITCSRPDQSMVITKSSEGRR